MNKNGTNYSLSIWWYVLYKSWFVYVFSFTLLQQFATLQFYFSIGEDCIIFCSIQLSKYTIYFMLLCYIWSWWQSRLRLNQVWAHTGVVQSLKSPFKTLDLVKVLSSYVWFCLAQLNLHAHKNTEWHVDLSLWINFECKNVELFDIFSLFYWGKMLNPNFAKVNIFPFCFCNVILIIFWDSP